MTPLLCRLCMFLGFIWGPICFQTLVMLTYLRKIFCLLMVTDIWKKNCHQHGLNNIFQNSAIELTVDLQSMNYGFKFYIYLILQILMNTIILKKVLTFLNAVQACHLLQTLINYMYICPISLSNWPKGKQVTYEINTCTYGCRRIWAWHHQ